MCGHSSTHFPLWIHSEGHFERTGRPSHWDGDVWAAHCGVTLIPASCIVWFSNSRHSLLWRTYIWFLNKANSNLGGYFKEFITTSWALWIFQEPKSLLRVLPFVSGRKYIHALAQAQTPKTRGFTVFNTWVLLICWLCHPIISVNS